MFWCTQTVFCLANGNRCLTSPTDDVINDR